MDEQVIPTQETVEQPVVEQEQPKEDRAANNLILMRQKLEREEEARKIAERKAAELEAYVRQNQQQPGSAPMPLPEDEDDNLGDPDSYLEVKQVRKLNKNTKKELSETKKELQYVKERLEMIEAQGTTTLLKNFNEVVNDDTIKTLARLYPEEYNTMLMNPSMSARAKIAYNMIQNYGIADTKVKDSDDRIAKNKSKPGAAALGAPQTPQTPLTKLNDYERRRMTEEDRTRILKRAQQIKDMY